MSKDEKQGVKKVILLDTHAILHRAYHALPDFTSGKGEPTGALYGLVTFLLKIIKELRPDHVIAAYDLPEPTFRHDEYKEYKAHREKADQALIDQLIRSRDVLDALGIPWHEAPGFEADDIIGTLAEELKKQEGVDVIIASGDMDTLQLVDDKKVTVYTLRKGLSDTVIYDEEAVKERFGFPPERLADYKGLSGDPSDNIPGVSGVGAKTATALITAFGSVEDIYRILKEDPDRFAEAGIKPRVMKLLEQGEEEAMFSKALAVIRRDAPVSFTLPEDTWVERVDREKIQALLSEFDFRSLRARIDDVISGSADGDDRQEPEYVPEEVSEREVREIGIAVWLLNSEITTPSLEDILEYSGKKTFAEAKKWVLEEVVRQGLEKVYREIELPLVSIIEAAQSRGMKVDVAYLKELSEKYHSELSKHEKEIFELAGEEFNINSPKQLGEVLFDRMGLSTKGLKKTAGGARSTRESELEKLRDTHPIIEKILSYRELQKLLSTYIDNIPSMVGEDGRLHTTLNQTGTTTGRMSSTNPNLQNIPARAGLGNAVRNGFVSDDGFVLLAFDYSQIEMRILAHLSGDETLIETFNSGKDVHSSVAARVFGVAEEDVTKDMRRKAKVINFGIIYGMGVNALKVNLGSTRAEAQEFYDNYFEKFPKISRYFDEVKMFAKKNGYTETFFGRRRHFPGMQSHIPYIRAMAERMAMNAPIQGTGADITKLAMIAVDIALKKAGLSQDAFFLLQVHDELIYEVKEESVTKAITPIRQAMEGVAKLSVPLPVDASQGKRWGEMREF